MVQPRGRLHHRVPDILRGPDADSLIVIEDDTGIEFDQLHRHGTPCGPDPHLRREGPQLRWAEPRRYRPPRPCRKSSSPHGMDLPATPWFQT